MKVEKYERHIGGRAITCHGYVRKVRYVIFFRTLGEYQRFRLLFEDEDSNYELVDMYANTYVKFGGKVVRENRYLDRLLVVSETEDRERLIEALDLRALSKKEREAKNVRSGMLAYEAV